jgi:hypothetical protein
MREKVEVGELKSCPHTKVPVPNTGLLVCYYDGVKMTERAMFLHVFIVQGW